MKTPKIVDRYGNPLRMETLEEEIASPSMTGVRQSWMMHSAAGDLTPVKLWEILQGANAGNDFDYLTLAEEMEERELHYGSVLSTRKLAVAGLELTVKAASDDRNDQMLADAVREQLTSDLFEDLPLDLLDALGKGRSTVEIVWQTGKLWQPLDFVWRDPRYFQWHRENAHEMRLRDEADMVNGVALPPCKFITHSPRLRTGIPVRRGLARPAAASFMCKSFTIRDWMAASELTGIPIRVGRYGANANAGDKAVLRRALANLGSDAAAMIPESMRIEFIERANSGGWHTLFLDLAEFIDKGVSKAVLGQTATTEGTPGKLGGDDAQGEVREDLKRADAKQLSGTLNRDFVKPFVDLNWGVQERYPSVSVYVPDNEDLNGLKDALAALLPQGLRVGQSFIRSKWGIPDPAPDEELLGVAIAPPTPTPTPVIPPQGVKGANSRHVDGCQCGGCLGVAKNAREPDAADRAVEAAMQDWEQVMTETVDDLGLLVIPEFDSEEQAKAWVRKQAQTLAGLDALVESLAISAMEARISGYADGK